MTTFRLRRGCREPNGLMTEHVTMGQVIKAASASAALSTAVAEGDFMVGDDAHVVWLTDEQRALVWSLRLDDETTPGALSGGEQGS